MPCKPLSSAGPPRPRSRTSLKAEDVAGMSHRPRSARATHHHPNSFDDPMKLEAGMIFAVETYCPAADGLSGGRIEEDVIVTPNGAQVITPFLVDEVATTGQREVRRLRRARARTCQRRLTLLHDSGTGSTMTIARPSVPGRMRQSVPPNTVEGEAG